MADLGSPSQRRPQLASVHLQFGSPDVIVRERRAIYDMASRFSGSCGLRPDEIDNPAVRHALGLYIATGDERLSADEIRPLRTFGNNPIAVIDESCQSNFMTVLDLLLGQQQLSVDESAVWFMSNQATDNLESRSSMVESAIDLLKNVAPGIVADLIPHIGGIGFIGTSGSIGLISASLREFPGLILLGDPQSPLEIAEALVHEGAHQKLFDIGILHGSFPEPTVHVAGFDVPWLTGTQWPLDQVIAAGHAYCYLAEFYDALGPTYVLSERSLLPEAARRATAIGDWLEPRQDALRPHAVSFLGSLYGFPGDAARAEANRGAAMDAGHGVESLSPGSARQAIRGSRRVLIGTPSSPPSFSWVTKS